MTLSKVFILIFGAISLVIPFSSYANEFDDSAGTDKIDCPPVIEYAVIDSIKPRVPNVSYAAYYTVRWYGADKIKVSVEEEYSSKLKSSYLYATEAGIVSGCADYITSMYCAWIDFIAENEYGKTTYTIELLPNGIVAGCDMIADKDFDTGNLTFEVFNATGMKLGCYDNYSEALANSPKGFLIIRCMGGNNAVEVKKIFHR